MKNPHFILKEDGPYLVDLPLEPNAYKNLTSSSWKKYEQDYEQAIKDAVKLKDKALGLKLFYDSVPKGQEQHDHPYKVDLSEYDVTISKVCVLDKKDVCRVIANCICRHDGEELRRVAILTPKKEENGAHLFTEGSEIFPSGTRSERDYPEDFKLENGNYQNKCIKCEQLFYGYKRRVMCDVCSKPTVAEESRDVIKEFKDRFQPTSLQTASINYFLESGNVSGELYLFLKDLTRKPK